MVHRAPSGKEKRVVAPEKRGRLSATDAICATESTGSVELRSSLSTALSSWPSTGAMASRPSPSETMAASSRPRLRRARQTPQPPRPTSIRVTG